MLVIRPKLFIEYFSHLKEVIKCIGDLIYKIVKQNVSRRGTQNEIKRQIHKIKIYTVG